MKLSAPIFFVTTAAALALSTAAGRAQLVRFDLTGLSSSTPPENVSATTVAAGLTPSLLTRGPGIVGAGLGNGFSANNWNNINSATSPTSATLANAMLTGDFYEFSISVDAGYTASLSTLDCSLRRSAIAAPMNYEWQYSLDGFATAGVGFADFNYFGRSSGTAPTTVDPFAWMTSDVPGQNNGNPISTIDLAGISVLQDINAGTTITFRLYGWGDDTNPGADSNTVALGRYDGPTIGGTVTVVPEPSTLAFTGIGLALLFIRRLVR